MAVLDRAGQSHPDSKLFIPTLCAKLLAQMNSFGITGGLFVFLLVAAAALPGAEFYRWVDTDGVIHFTDNLQTIPNSRRGTIIRMQGQERSRPETAKPAPPDLTKASVPFERHGQVVVVEALLNKKTAAKLVVDTGATFTMISAATARELNLDYSQTARTMPFQTANGVIHAPLTDLESITVGGIEIKNLTAAIHDAVPGANVGGLLGLNFLSNFRMDIDTTKGLLHLEKK
jgi:clan AA aspartic protease (TIGR02281 family)